MAGQPPPWEREGWTGLAALFNKEPLQNAAPPQHTGLETGERPPKTATGAKRSRWDREAYEAPPRRSPREAAEQKERAVVQEHQRGVVGGEGESRPGMPRVGNFAAAAAAFAPASTLMPPPPPPPRLHQQFGSPAAKMGATKRLSDGEAKHVGPHPSTIKVSAQYMSQNALEKKLRPPNAGSFDAQERSIAEAREDSMRLQGCTWIDQVRRLLQLPLRTYTTACLYYHKFRLANPGALNGMDYGNSWTDACAASLLTACKTEDTLKKSRDILAAAYNLKAGTHDQVGPDDPMFEAPSRSVIGLERMVLEASNFDFRSKHPDRLMMKILKKMPEGADDERLKVRNTAWSALTDLFRTLAPVKQTTATMAFASIELAAQLYASSSPNNVSAIRDELQQFDTSPFAVSREEVMETLLDALDMYTQHTAQTILGTKYSLDEFLRIRLAFNKECSEKNLPRYTTRQPRSSTLHVSNGHPTPVSPPQTGTQQQPAHSQPIPENGGTQRFVLNPALAAEEKVQVNRYFVEEWEEYEEEVEVPIARPADTGPRPNPLADRPDRPPPRPKDGHDGRDRERDRGRERPPFERRRFDDGYGRYDDRRDRRGYYERR